MICLINYIEQNIPKIMLEYNYSKSYKLITQELLQQKKFIPLRTQKHFNANYSTKIYSLISKHSRLRRNRQTTLARIEQIHILSARITNLCSKHENSNLIQNYTLNHTTNNKQLLFNVKTKISHTYSNPPTPPPKTNVILSCLITPKLEKKQAQ